jgi:hypothetical protein
MNLADVLIEVYVAESTLLRVEKIIGLRGEKESEIQKEMAMIYLHFAVERAASAARQAIYAFADGDELRLMLLGLKRFTKIDPFNLKDARRKVANYVIDKGEYPF